MRHKLRFTREAKDQLDELKTDPKKLKKVQKCLAFLETDQRHPGLRSHKYSQMKSESNQGVWESYVENNSPSAWRVFWFFGPEAEQITVTAIVEHP